MTEAADAMLPWRKKIEAYLANHDAAIESMRQRAQEDGERIQQLSAQVDALRDRVTALEGASS